MAGNVEKREAPTFFRHRIQIRLDENLDGLLAGRNLDMNRRVAEIDLVASSVLSSNDGVGHYRLPPTVRRDIRPPSSADAPVRLGRRSAAGHEALDCPPRVIFERYFGRKPPFDQGKKEFPDAFVIEALANWCTKTGSTMYLVTADAAMQRAAIESQVLIPVHSLEALLKMAAEAETLELSASVEKVIDTDQFKEKIRHYVEEHIGWLGLIYSGDLPEGEILEAVVAGEPEIQKISVISASRDVVGVMVSITVPLEVTVQYEDRSHALYDKEDDRWHLTEQETMEFEDEPLVRMYIEFERPDMTVAEMNLTTTDLHLSEPYENYK